MYSKKMKSIHFLPPPPAEGVYQFDFGSQFPDQGLNQGHSSESPGAQQICHKGTPTLSYLSGIST